MEPAAIGQIASTYPNSITWELGFFNNRKPTTQAYNTEFQLPCWNEELLGKTIKRIESIRVNNESINPNRHTLAAAPQSNNVVYLSFVMCVIH